MIHGIEISQTAIDLAQKHFGNDLTIYHGSVTEMPLEKPTPKKTSNSIH